MKNIDISVHMVRAFTLALNVSLSSVLGSVLTLVLILFSNLSQADDCLDVFSQASQANSSFGLNLLANTGVNGHAIATSGAGSYPPGDYFHLSGQLGGDYQFQATGVSSRVYFTSLAISGTATINTNDAQNLILLVDGDIAIAGNVSLNAIIYATGNITINDNVFINGAVTALGSISTGPSVTVTYNASAIGLADFSSLCTPPPTQNTFAFGTSSTTNVTFDVPFDTYPPVVILMPTINSNDPENDGPSTLNLTSISTTGFQYYQAQPPGSNVADKPMPEVTWMAFAQGNGTLPDGRSFTARYTSLNNFQHEGSDTGQSWKQLFFPIAFQSTPQVFHQLVVTNFNNNCWLTSVAKRSDATSFFLALEASEVSTSSFGGWDYYCRPSGAELDQNFKSEQIAWVAIETGEGAFSYKGDNIKYQVGAKQAESSTYTLSGQCNLMHNFGTYFDQAPYVIAKKYGRWQYDGGWTRLCKVSNTGFSVVNDEDQYTDSERNHYPEWVSYMAISSPPPPPVPSLRFENTLSDALTCDEHSITVQALLDNQADGSYVGTITLTTDSNKGKWALLTGSGSFSGGGNNGNGSYTFSAADQGKATFTLHHPKAGQVLTTVSDGTSSDNISIAFRPFGLTSGLNQSATPTGFANTDYDITFTAVGKKNNGFGECEVISNYEGDKNIAFWTSYEDPVSPAAATQLVVNGTSVSTSEANATIKVITFTAGKAVITFSYPDAGKVKLNMKDVQGLPSNTRIPLIGNSNFIANPQKLLFTDIKNSSAQANPGGNITGGGGFTSAGTNFKATVMAVMNKGMLNCNEVASGYCLTPSFEHSNLVISHTLKTPDPGNTGILNGTVKAIANGQVTFDEINFSEVGSITLSVIAESYLQTGNHINGDSNEVGRFYPAKIILNSSTLRPACNNTFTYLDQPQINLDYELHALNSQNGITKNYHWPKYNLLGAFGGYASDGITDLSLRLEVPTLTVNWLLGKYTVINYPFGLKKNSTPDGPFLDVTMGLQFIGPDGETITDTDFNPADSNCISNSSCTAKSLGNGGDLYFGRLSTVNGYGSELAGITVNQRIETFNSANGQFTVNSLDTCSQLDPSHITLTPAAGSNAMQIGAGTSTLNVGTSNSGLLPLVFSSPGENNTGLGDFTINLLNSLPWLRHDWNEDSILDDTVTGSITFGIYKGSQRLIYKTEQGVN